MSQQHMIEIKDSEFFEKSIMMDDGSKALSERNKDKNGGLIKNYAEG